MKEYENTIKIITSIIERYNSYYPDIFRRLNKYEKDLLVSKPRHSFSLEDCKNTLRQYSNYMYYGRTNPYRDDIISLQSKNTQIDCIMLTYNWYKSKIIYHIEEVDIDYDVVIDKETLKKFPYSGIYLDLKFYKLKYLGCFLTKIRAKTGYSLQDYLLVGYVRYDEKLKAYGIESFLVKLQDGLSVESAFKIWYESNVIPLHKADNRTKTEFKENSKAIAITIHNLYKIINTLNSKISRKSSPVVKRAITSQNFSLTNNKEYVLSRESKYRYVSRKQSVANGSPKSPHIRRGHFRHLKVRDNNGKVIGENAIWIREQKIHSDQESVISVKIIPK